MATTDGNGIVFLEETDPISPFHTTINTLQQGTSDAIGDLLAVALQDVTVDTQIFTSNGTWTKPPGAVRVRVRAQGGGGSGGGCPASTANQSSAGSGGGGGAYAESWFDASSLASSVSVTCGAGGAAGSAGAAGNAGGTSSFGTHVIAPGGGGGTVRTSSAASFSGANGGLGGTGATGDIVVSGSDGGVPLTTGLFGVSGYGGSSHLGGSAQSQWTGSPSARAGYEGKLYGGGGSGAVSSNGSAAAAGGAGANGIVIVETIVASV